MSEQSNRARLPYVVVLVFLPVIFIAMVFALVEVLCAVNDCSGWAGLGQAVMAFIVTYAVCLLIMLVAFFKSRVWRTDNPVLKYGLYGYLILIALIPLWFIWGGY